MPAPTARPVVAQAGEGFETVACALCGGAPQAVVLTSRNWDRPAESQPWFQVVQCRGCGLQFTNPRPDPAGLRAYYPEQYYSYVPTIAPVGLNPWKRLEAWTRQATRVAFYGYPAPGGCLKRWWLGALVWPLWLRLRWTGKDQKTLPWRGRGRLLEVGCGTGGSLAYQRACGLTVTGVEWSATAARIAGEQHGLDVRAGTLEEAGFPDGAFDLIYMSHVFEHFADPARTLREMWRILDAGGLAILKVPNVDSASARQFGAHWLGLDVPRHLYHFSPATLRALLERHGFIVESIEPDRGSGGWWRESRRIRHEAGEGSAPRRSRWRNLADQWMEWRACRSGCGSVLTVRARKAAPSTGEDLQASARR